MARKKVREESKVASLLATISRPGSLAVLKLAENGIRDNVKYHHKASISKRQYTLRLGELATSGLIKKKKGMYQQTVFGKVLCQDYIPRFEGVYLSTRQTHE